MFDLWFLRDSYRKELLLKVGGSHKIKIQKKRHAHAHVWRGRWGSGPIVVAFNYFRRTHPYCVVPITKLYIIDSRYWCHQIWKQRILKPICISLIIFLPFSTHKNRKIWCCCFIISLSKNDNFDFFFFFFFFLHDWNSFPLNHLLYLWFFNY